MKTITGGDDPRWRESRPFDWSTRAIWDDLVFSRLAIELTAAIVPQYAKPTSNQARFPCPNRPRYLDGGIH